MGKEIVVIRTVFATPVAAVAMAALAMTGVDKALRYDTPLDGGVVSSAERKTFINTPADRAVVNNDVALVERTEAVPTISSVFRHICITKTETKETENDIVGLYRKRIVCDADTVAGSSLSGNSHVSASQFERGVEMNVTRYIKDNGAGA